MDKKRNDIIIIIVVLVVLVIVVYIVIVMTIIVIIVEIIIVVIEIEIEIDSIYIDHNINATMQPAYYTSTNSKYTLVVSVKSHTVILHNNNSNNINTVVSEVSHNTAI